VHIIYISRRRLRRPRPLATLLPNVTRPIDGAHPGLHMESVHDLLAEHDVAAYPAELSVGDEASGAALAMLDADIAALAAAYIENRGALPAELWQALIECAAVARVIVPGLTGDAWVYFARLYALSQAMLRTAPDIPAH
jgi:hypothetical protein